MKDPISPDVVRCTHCHREMEADEEQCLDCGEFVVHSRTGINRAADLRREAVGILSSSLRTARASNLDQLEQAAARVQALDAKTLRCTKPLLWSAGAAAAALLLVAAALALFGVFSVEDRYLAYATYPMMTAGAVIALVAVILLALTATLNLRRALGHAKLARLARDIDTTRETATTQRQIEAARKQAEKAARKAERQAERYEHAIRFNAPAPASHAPTAPRPERKNSVTVVVLATLSLFFGLPSVVGAFIPVFGSLYMFVLLPCAMLAVLALIIALVGRTKCALPAIALCLLAIGILVAQAQHQMNKEYVEERDQEAAKAATQLQAMGFSPAPVPTPLPTRAKLSDQMAHDVADTLSKEANIIQRDLVTKTGINDLQQKVKQAYRNAATPRATPVTARTQGRRF